MTYKSGLHTLATLMCIIQFSTRIEIPANYCVVWVSRETHICILWVTRPIDIIRD